MPVQDDQPQIALSQHSYDRIADRRVDDAWLAEVWSDPGTRVLVVAGNRIRLDAGRVEWISPAQAPAGTRVLLGDREGVIHLAVLVDPAYADESWTPLRGTIGTVAEQDASFLVHAVGIAEWHWATRHCARCGGALASESAGHVLRCTQCDRMTFPRTDAAVIMLITDAEDRCLLGRQPRWPEGRFSTLAGFVEPGESLEVAVRREVAEETGVRVGPVEYFGSQPWPLPASLMLGYFGRAVSTEISVDGEEIEAAQWFTREEVRAGAEDGTLLLPRGISISRSLVESWYGGELPGGWA